MIFLPFPVGVTLLLALLIGAVVVMRGRGPATGASGLFLRLIALMLWAGALVVGAVGLQYGLVGLALHIPGTWALVPIGLTLAFGMAWAGRSLWRRTTGQAST